MSPDLTLVAHVRPTSAITYRQRRDSQRGWQIVSGSNYTSTRTRTQDSIPGAPNQERSSFTALCPGGERSCLSMMMFLSFLFKVHRLDHRIYAIEGNCARKTEASLRQTYPGSLPGGNKCPMKAEIRKLKPPRHIAHSQAMTERADNKLAYRLS